MVLIFFSFLFFFLCSPFTTYSNSQKHHMEIFIIAWKVDLGGEGGRAGPLMGKNLHLLPLHSWISITRNFMDSYCFGVCFCPDEEKYRCTIGSRWNICIFPFCPPTILQTLSISIRAITTTLQGTIADITHQLLLAPPP